MSVVPSDLFPSVYSYLVSNGFEKTAKAFRKEVKCVPSLVDGPNLMDIFQDYQNKASNGPDHLKSIENMESFTDQDVNLTTRKRKLPLEAEERVSKKIKKERKKKKLEVNGDEKVEVLEDQSGGGHDTNREANTNGEEEETSCEEEQLLNDETNVQTVTDSSSNKKKKKKMGIGSIIPFKRVKDTEDVDPRLADNSFEAKMGAKGSWGEKANKDLKFTKGRSFRHEKTKKKRGSYKGGLIDTSVNSIKFDSD